MEQFRNMLDKLKFFDELHIYSDSEYGYYLTYINTFRHVNVVHYFTEYEDLYCILLDLISEFELKIGKVDDKI